MYCRTCGAELRPGDIFCGICGSRTGNPTASDIGERSESVLAAAKQQMMQGAPTTSDILSISSVLETAGEVEEGGTVLLEEPGGVIPGVNDTDTAGTLGFVDRSMSLQSGGSGSSGQGRSYPGKASETDESGKVEIPGLWAEWKVKERIGQGSFGTVYRIEKQDFGRSVSSALKVISIPQNRADIDSLYSEGMSTEEISHYYTDAVQKIVDEFDLMSQLRGHSNIVSYEDHKVIPKPDGIGYDILIRMELLTPFNQYLRENGNEIGRMEVLRLGVDICHALEACETMHVIHRDIKPENLFIHHLGNFKLGDFGVAREMEKTMTVMSKKGTYSYMAPEVYAGKEYDRTVDLYSLGIMLYRYFNGGRLPFVEQGVKVTSDYREQALMKRISGVPIPPPQYARENIWRVIQKACAFHPADRYQSAEEMRRDLEAVAQEVAARAHEEPGRGMEDGLAPGKNSAGVTGAKKQEPDREKMEKSRDSAKGHRPEYGKKPVYEGRPVAEAEEENVTVSGIYGSERPGQLNGQSEMRTVLLDPERGGGTGSGEKASGNGREAVKREAAAPPKKKHTDVSLYYYKNNVKEYPERSYLLPVFSFILLGIGLILWNALEHSFAITGFTILTALFLFVGSKVNYDSKVEAYMEEYYRWKAINS